MTPPCPTDPKATPDAHAIAAKLAAIAAELATMEIPPRLEATVARHKADLLALAEQLFRAGVDQAVIETSITVLFERFKNEMVRTIAELQREE